MIFILKIIRHRLYVRYYNYLAETLSAREFLSDSRDWTNKGVINVWEQIRRRFM